MRIFLRSIFRMTTPCRVSGRTSWNVFSMSQFAGRQSGAVDSGEEARRRKDSISFRRGRERLVEEYSIAGN